MRTGKDNRRKNDHLKEVPGGMIWKEMKDVLLTMMVGVRYSMGK